MTTMNQDRKQAGSPNSEGGRYAGRRLTETTTHLLSQLLTPAEHRYYGLLQTVEDLRLDSHLDDASHLDALGRELDIQDAFAAEDLAAGRTPTTRVERRYAQLLSDLARHRLNLDDENDSGLLEQVGREFDWQNECAYDEFDWPQAIGS